MPETSTRFFVIRPDGTTSTVTAEQLNTMRINGIIGPEDKVVPLPGQIMNHQINSSLNEREVIQNIDQQVIVPALKDIDTAPLNFVSPTIPRITTSRYKHASFDDVDDIEINQAFSKATSPSLYHMDAQQSSNFLPPQNSILGENTRDYSTQVIFDNAPLYTIQFPDGRIIGPFDSNNLWQRFAQHMLTGTEQIAMVGSDKFKPILDYVDFKAAHKIFNSENLFPKQSFNIDSASIAPLLLRLAHQLVTGWVIVKNHDATLIISLSIGKLINIRSNQIIQDDHEGLLSKLFSFEEGIAWFEADSLVASDERAISRDILALCRHLTATKNGFGLNRLIKVVGNQSNTLQLITPAEWYVSQSQFNNLEQIVFNQAEQTKSINQTLRELLTMDANEEESLHAIFILIIANCAITVTEKVTQEINEFTNQLFSNEFIQLLDINSETPENNIDKKLSVLKDQITHIEELMPSTDLRIQQMEERFKYIKRIMRNKTERYVQLKAYENNIDIKTSADFAFKLKKEYLEKTIPTAIAEGRYLEILPEAELYYELCPDNSDALAYFLLARFFASASTEENFSTLDMTKQALKRFPESVTILLAAETIFTSTHNFKLARTCIKKLKQMGIDREKVSKLESDLNNEMLIPFSDESASLSPWISVMFTSIITFAMIGLLWLLAVDIELGSKETITQKVDLFIWIRAAVLLFFASAGFLAIYRKGPSIFFYRLTYKASWVWISLAIVSAFVVAFVFDLYGLGDIEFSFISGISLLAAIFFDRLYFSGFLGQNLIQSAPNKWIGICLLTLLYTGYYFTFYEIMQQNHLQILNHLLIICFVISLPMALLQYFSKSVLPPFLFQFIFIFAEFFKIVSKPG